MKKSKRFLGMALAVFAGVLISCGDITETGGEKSGIVRKKEGKVSVSLSVNSGAKTIMPSNLQKTDIYKIELSAQILGDDNNYTEYTFDDEKSVKSWEALKNSDDSTEKSAFEAMTEDSVLLDYGTYSFTLNLYSYDTTEQLVQSGALSDFEVSASTTSLSFITTYAEYGNLALTFQWNCESDGTSKIGRIDAGLFTLESKAQTAFTNDGTSYDLEELTISEESGKKSAKYTEQQIPNGTYYLKYRVFDSTGSVVLNTILDVVKIHGYKTEKTIELDLEKINSLQRNAFSNVSISDARLLITCEPEGTLYLNSGTIAIKAYDPNGEQIDTSNISAKLFYSGTELDSDFYQWIDDGFVMLGTGAKLVTGGTYQLYVTASATVDSEVITDTAIFDIEVEDKEYYYVDVTNDTDYATTLASDMRNLSAPAIVEVTGEGVDTYVDEEDSSNNVTGTLRTISNAIQGDSSDGYNNLAYSVELDMSEVTGITKVANGDIRAIALCKVELPKTVTAIETQGFNMSSVYVSDSDIYSKLESVTIPSGITSIASNPFYNCSALKKISVAEGNENFSTALNGTVLFAKDGDGLKLVCTTAVAFDEIDFASSELSSVTSLEESAFKNAESIGTVKNLANITSFGNKVFEDKTIDSLTIANIPTLEDGVYPFYNTTVKNLTIDCDVTEGNFEDFEKFVAYLDTTSYYYSRSGIANIENLVFNGYAYIKDTSSPSSSATNGEVDAYMFYSSHSTLEIIQFNKGAYVGKYQFQKEFSKLKTVTFAGSEESVIGDSAFAQNSEYSTGITSLTLNGVTTIGNYAFNYNNGLTSLSIPATVTSLSDTAFSGCSGIESIKVESGNTKYKSSTDGKFLMTADGALILAAGDISEIDFTDSGVKSISSTPFWNRETSITKLNLSGVEHLGQQAFYNCQNLAEVEWGTTLKSIGELAFYSINITDITLPDSIIALAPSAFQEYVATGTATQYTSFTIGGVGADSASQPTNWYMLKGSDKATLWQNYIDNKPSTITESDDIVKLPASGSTEKVIQTIQTDVCNQYQRSNSTYTGNGY